MKGAFSTTELELAQKCLEMARNGGASSVRVSASKTLQNTIGILDGNFNKISYSEERSFYFDIFVNGSYGHYSTNRLTEDDLNAFIKQAIEATRLISSDSLHSLPDPSRKADNCAAGDELEIYDPYFSEIAQDNKLQKALDADSSGRTIPAGIKILSTESEYSDNLDDSYLVDSDGFEGRQIETSYGFCSEVTLADRQGNKMSGYWWESSPFWAALVAGDVLAEALASASRQAGQKKAGSGRYNIVVDRACASKLVSPVLNALNGNELLQENSFLANSSGKAILGNNLTVIDNAIAPGCAGSRLFDNEAVRTGNNTIIENGSVQQYFISEYVSRKTGWKPTVSGVSRPCIAPFICNCTKKEVNLKDILSLCQDGIYVTGFNGGNCNPATGNFSYGIEGLLFEKGEFVRPVNEMLMTGNMVDLFNRLVAAGSDARKCTRWQIPSLAFEQIDING